MGVALASLFTVTTSHAAPSGKVLILSSSVSSGTSSLEAMVAGSGSVSAGELGTLTGLGYSVDVVSDAQWSSMTTAQFAAYQAIVLGDATCTLTIPAAAVANAATWSAAVTGNVVLVGTDPVFHYHNTRPDIAQVTYNAVKFAASSPGGATGAYVGLSCYYANSGANTPVPLLSGFGSFTVRGEPTFNPACFNNSHIVAVNPALAGLTDAILSNWSCSVHEAFDTFPTSTFIPLAIANTVTGEGSLTFADGTSGVPYILARGATPVRCGNGLLESPEQCDDGASNGTCGDACSSICKLHWCGDGVVDPGEACDLGCANGAAGSACSSTCTSIATATPPSCALTSIVDGPPKQLDITVQSSSGLQTVTVTDSTNATVAVPSFSAGDTSPQVVVATKVDQTTGAHVALTITDVNGLTTTCDPVVPGEPATQQTSAVSDGSSGNGMACSVGRIGAADPLSRGAGLFLAVFGLAFSLRRRKAK